MNNLKADVRWTSAQLRLDEVDFIIFFPTGEENANRVLLPMPLCIPLTILLADAF